MKKDILIHKSKTILDALNKLNSIRDVSRLILFVENDDGDIIGSLTDGDIRRSLVTDYDLNREVGSICYKQFAYIEDNKSYVDLSEYRKKNLKILPVLDKNKRLIKILDLEKVKAQLPLECMIMAGGRGKRLSPLTDTTPKPMLLLGDKPIIEHNIDRLIEYGIQKIYISIKYLGEQIKEYFGDGSSKGIQIEYIWEDTPLGTAGALSLVKKFNTKQILLMNSDLFTNIDFEELYLKLLSSNSNMIVASTEYKIDIPYAIFNTKDDLVTDFKEKPTFIYQSNAGIYILERELINIIPKNQFYDITDLMEKLIKENGKLTYNPIIGYWIDIGKPIDYIQAQEFIKHF